MQIEAGKFRYDFPGDYVRAAGVWDKDRERDPCAIFYALTQLEPADMLELHKKMQDEHKEFVAMPMYISNIDQELWLYPIPDRALIAQVEYETVRFL